MKADSQTGEDIAQTPRGQPRDVIPLLGSGQRRVPVTRVNDTRGDGIVTSLRSRAVHGDGEGQLAMSEAG